jgi:hypothetical protein
MKHLVIVLTEPTADREAEYHDYYENRHLDEVLATTGWISAQRFKLADQQGMACPLPYLAVYEVEADDPRSVLAGLNAARPQRVQSHALNRKTAGAWVFSEIGPRHTGD